MAMKMRPAYSTELSWLRDDSGSLSHIREIFSAKTSFSVTFWRALFDREAPLPQDRAMFHALSGAKLNNAILARQAEFIAGRCLADRALGGSGLRLLRTTSGAPEWPLEVTGSISHGGNRVMVLVGPRSRYLGVDVEPLLSPIALEAVLSRVVAPCEERWMRGMEAPLRLRTATVVFSAKETLFKALSTEFDMIPSPRSFEVVEPPRNWHPLKLRLSASLSSQLPAGLLFLVGYGWLEQDAFTWLDMPRRHA